MSIVRDSILVCYRLKVSINYVYMPPHVASIRSLNTSVIEVNIVVLIRYEILMAAISICSSPLLCTSIVTAC